MKISLTLVSCVFLFLSTAQAAITVTGDVSPDDPSTWTLKTYGIIRECFAGCLVVDGDSEVFSRDVNVGQGVNITGIITFLEKGHPGRVPEISMLVDTSMKDYQSLNHTRWECAGFNIEVREGWVKGIAGSVL